MTDNALSRYRARFGQKWTTDEQDEANRQRFIDAADKPTLAGKTLGLLGLDESGERGATSWGDAALSTLHMPFRAAEGAYSAFTAPARAYRGEIPDENMIGEGLNFAGNMAVGGSAIPRPGNALASNSIRPGTLLADAGENALSRPGIRAYHGSPHDFDKFDLSKIGTGEGAQAFGHGLYFAENEGVAKSYRDALKADNPNKLSSANDRFKHLELDGKPIGQQFDIDPSYVDEFKAKIASGEDIKPLLGEKLARWKEMMHDGSYPFPQYAKDKVSAYQGLIDRLKSGGQLRDAGAGRMYEVSINADPADFLDWDKPLSQQSEKVRERLAKVSKDHYDPASPDYDASEPGEMVAQRLRSMVGDSGMTKAMRDAAIPGIKYLDQGSRSTGEGSRNYVVFDDALISILRKYGLLGTLGAGGAAAGLMGGAQPSEAAPSNALSRR
jgi:hypothetical protein